MCQGQIVINGNTQSFKHREGHTRTSRCVMTVVSENINTKIAAKHHYGLGNAKLHDVLEMSQQWIKFFLFILIQMSVIHEISYLQTGGQNTAKTA